MWTRSPGRASPAPSTPPPWVAGPPRWTSAPSASMATTARAPPTATPARPTRRCHSARSARPPPTTASASRASTTTKVRAAALCRHSWQSLLASTTKACALQRPISHTLSLQLCCCRGLRLPVPCKPLRGARRPHLHALPHHHGHLIQSIPQHQHLVPVPGSVHLVSVHLVLPGLRHRRYHCAVWQHYCGAVRLPRQYLRQPRAWRKLPLVPVQRHRPGLRVPPPG
jgi:hypothetical protein